MLRDVGIQRHFQESVYFALCFLFISLLLLLFPTATFSVLDASLATSLPSIQLIFHSTKDFHQRLSSQITKWYQQKQPKMMHTTKKKDGPPSPAEEAEIALEANDVEVDAQTQKRIMRKLDLRIIPMVMWM